MMIPRRESLTGRIEVHECYVGGLEQGLPGRLNLEKGPGCGSRRISFDRGLLVSFALPDVVTAIEDEFGIKVPDSDLTPRKFESVANIERYIVSRR